MNRIVKFVSNLVSRAERPVPRAVSAQKPSQEIVAAPQQSALSREHSTALAGRDYDVDSRGIKWHRLT